MGEVLDLQVLVLNRYFSPVQLTSVRRALMLLYGGSALAVEGGDLYDFDHWRGLPAGGEREALPIVGGLLRVPRILHLQRYERTPRATVRLSRKNLMLRDGHQCQYCARTLAARDLNIDHVVPRSRGGRDTWENLVTACKTCNLRKGARTPDEASMRLLREPTRPRWTPATRILLGAAVPYPEWQPYLMTA